jgi:hypothetical protein
VEKMETVIVVLVCMALIVFGAMAMAQGFLTSTDSAALSLEDITVAKGEMMRTGISLIGAGQTGADLLEAILENSGQIKLAGYSKWDVIVQYYDSGGTYYIKWLLYTEATLGDNEWQKTGIYLDAGDETPEAFEPGILNPEEEMKIEAKLNPPPQGGTTVDLIICTPNGVPESASFVY